MVTGSDAQRTRQVDFRGIPDVAREIITETTFKGDYINIELMKCFKNSDRLSQSDLARQVTQDQGVQLTPNQVRAYILKLERAGMMAGPPTIGTQPKEYSLTARGTWCRSLISSALPKTNLLFYWRNYIGRRRVPPEPGNRVSGTAP